jgi:predicted RNase H-like HicB family nuclease
VTVPHPRKDLPAGTVKSIERQAEIRLLGKRQSNPMTSYIGLIRKDGESDFGVDFPDFPGCVSAGATLDEARRLAQEALELHVDGMVEDGEELPAPSSLEAVMSDPENGEAVAFLVSLPEAPERTVRVNITLPERLLRRIDERAKNRSAFLARAADKALAES